MVDKLAEKVDKSPLNRGRFVYSWDFQNCPLYHGCPLLRGSTGADLSRMRMHDRSVNLRDWSHSNQEERAKSSFGVGSQTADRVFEVEDKELEP